MLLFQFFQFFQFHVVVAVTWIWMIWSSQSPGEQESQHCVSSRASHSFTFAAGFFNGVLRLQSEGYHRQAACVNHVKSTPRNYHDELSIKKSSMEVCNHFAVPHVMFQLVLHRHLPSSALHWNHLVPHPSQSRLLVVHVPSGFVPGREGISQFCSE